jgi:hypothetical protein
MNIEDELSPERKSALKNDVGNTDSLLLVKGELWARIESPHPTKRQKAFYKADWRPEDVEAAGSLKKMPGIKE